MDEEKMTEAPAADAAPSREARRREAEARRRAALRKSRRRWRRFLLIYSVCFLLLGAAGCFTLYRYFAAYEVSRPEHVMDDLMAKTTPDDWYAYARATLRMDVTRFEDPQTLFDEYFNTYLRDADYTYRKDTGVSTAATPVYVVRAGAVDLCTVALTPQGQSSAGFGLALWQVGSVTSCFAPEGLQSVTVEIQAPAGQTVNLNGIPLEASDVADGAVAWPDMSELEKRFTAPACAVLYRVGPLYGSITVTDGAGTELSPRTGSPDGTVRYEVEQTDFYSFTVRAPADVTVTVCGAVLTSADASQTGAGVLKGLEADTGGGACDTVTYSFDQLYTKPVITAADSGGNELTPVLGENGHVAFFHRQDDALYAETADRVKEFFTRYVEYSSQAYSEGRYNSLLSCILPGTKLYSYVADSQAAMIWASATKVSYDELTFTDFARVSDACFTCTIRYKADFSATSWYTSYTYGLQNAYELAFVKTDGVWYAAAMSVV